MGSIDRGRVATPAKFGTALFAAAVIAVGLAAWNATPGYGNYFSLALAAVAGGALTLLGVWLGIVRLNPSRSTPQPVADREYQESEQRLPAFLKHSEIIGWIKDEEGRYVFLSENYQRRFGVRLEDWQGKTDLGIWPPDIAEVFRQNDQAVLKDRRAVEIVEESINHDGSQSWWLVRKFPFQDATGKWHIGGLGVDITQRKLAEEGLRQTHDELEQHVYLRTKDFRDSEERFRATFDQAAVGIAHVSADGKFLRVNQKLCEIVGYTPDELMARTFQEVTYPEDLDADLENVRRMLLGDIKTYSMEKRYYRKDKSLVWINLTVSLVRDDAGQPKYFISVIEDISRRKNAEEQLRSEGQLLVTLLDLQEQERQMVAHDIHDGFVQDVVGAHMHVQSIHGETDSATIDSSVALVAALLEKAIAEGRRLIRDLRPIVLDESGVIEAILHLIADKQKNEGFTVAFAHDVKFDRLDTRLEGTVFRIVQEALNNVTHHGQVDHAAVQITQANGTLQLVVRDRGVGFDPEQVSPDRFGLRGIRERARLFGGTATIESVPAEGTTVTVKLPLNQTIEPDRFSLPSK